MELIKPETIQHKIYTVRGVQIILDKDLAQFYGVKPIRLREQIKRNPNRFPPDFVFQLSESEIDYMVSQNAIPSKQSLGGSLPLVFTEQGVAAVSGVIKSDKADQVSVAIARAFVAMRKTLGQLQGVIQRQQNPAITLVENRSSHDRFIIIDDTQLYHIGASLKDLGNKCFAFSRMDNVLPELTTKLLKA